MPASTRLTRVQPALGALLYPVLIWCGPAIAPIFLVAAMMVPAMAVVILHRTAAAFRRSRMVAALVIGSPALYSWLGGLLDFQNALPVDALGVWVPLWTAAAVITLADTPRASHRERRASRLAFAHGVSATAITLFAAIHVINHVGGFWGADTHLAMMTSLRVAYRQRVVEAILLASVAFQFVSGARLLWDKAGRSGDWFDTLQTASGAYLACFFLSHLTAALRARARGVDTNWMWLTADSMLTDAWSARLAPYYFLGVIAVGVHVAAGLRHVLIARGHARHVADRAFAVIAIGAIAAAILIMAGLLRT
jgi:succinate dehydrogenase/fumarate reductase cytochrome b subunit